MPWKHQRRQRIRVSPCLHQHGDDGPATQRTKLWEGRCVRSRAEAGEGYRETSDLEAWGCSRFQRGAPWVAWHKQVAVFPTVSCKVIVGLLCALQMDGPGSWCFSVNLWALGEGTPGKAWAVQYRVFKGLSKKGPHLNVSGWAANFPSYF